MSFQNYKRDNSLPVISTLTKQILTQIFDKYKSGGTMEQKLIDLINKGYTHLELDSRGCLFASNPYKSKMEFINLDIKISEPTEIESILKEMGEYNV